MSLFINNQYLFKPSRCIIELTYECNLLCSTCNIGRKYKHINKFNNIQISFEMIDKIQNTLLKFGIKRITYLGGEPFLRKDILSIASNAQDLGISTAVVTNGSSINTKDLYDIASNRIFDIMIFSIDGPEHIHDYIRGVPKTFKTVTENIYYLQKLRKSKKRKYPKIYIYVTLSSINWEYIYDIFLLAQKLDVHAVKFISISCITDNLINLTNQLFKSPAIKSHSYFIDTSLKIPEYAFPKIQKDLMLIKKEAQKIGMRVFIEEYLLNNKGAKFCNFLGKDFIISNNGDIYLCPMLPEYTVGNIYNTPLYSILQHPNISYMLNNIKKISQEKKLNICKECCVEKLDLDF